ncbi:TPA: transporter, partial [Streptococcus equi subsp. equi]|nr:transporter [Streptococcus equi subsp. equi]HEL1428611.1 transporter [Streptococcus equi subsp. equi]HEL1466567.1 transporter [Streptococcus equi subsp. equi]
AVFIANIITIIPMVFTFWIGVKADKTKRKTRNLIVIGFIQSLLFTLVALLMTNQTFLVFAFVGFLNVVSDILSDYKNGLRLPIMQKNIESEKLYEAYSFAQFIGYLSSIAGQALGVWLLTTSGNNYAFVALINAISFLLSSVVLLKNRQKLRHDVVEASEAGVSLMKQFKVMYTRMTETFKKIDHISFVMLLLSILTLNAIGGAINSIYHFYLMDHQLFHFHYGQSLVIVDAVTIIGAMLGNLTPKDYFSRLSISKLVQTQGIAFLLVGVSNALQLPAIIGVLCLAFAAYIMGKATPKLDALLMENLPSDMLAQSNNFLGLLFSLSLPVGVFIFSFLALYNMTLCWILFMVLSLAALALSTSSTRG